MVNVLLDETETFRAIRQGRKDWDAAGSPLGKIRDYEYAAICRAQVRNVAEWLVHEGLPSVAEALRAAGSESTSKQPLSESACAVCGDRDTGILCSPPCELYGTTQAEGGGGFTCRDLQTLGELNRNSGSQREAKEQLQEQQVTGDE